MITQIVSINISSLSTLTIRKLDSGDISIYYLLATDTLCFATAAEGAVEHERRCLDTFLQKVVRDSRQSKSSIEDSPSASSSLGISPDQSSRVSRISHMSSRQPLTAWNDATDGRWQELYKIAELDIEEHTIIRVGTRQDDTMNEGKLAAAKPITRKKPILLFFPNHNNPILLGSYRVFILLQR
jgi:hypothetical protein